MENTKQETISEVIRKPEIVATDARGVIEKHAEASFNSVLRITSKKGAVRANHYHKRDSHLCYLVSGKIRYVEQDLKIVSGAEPVLNDKSPLVEYIVSPGELFYTKPMIGHAMEFLEDSEFYAYTSLERDQGAYEEDTVRVILIDPKEAELRAKNENESS